MGKKSKKDSITGIALGKGLTLRSDKIYTDKSPEVVALLGERNSTYTEGGGTQWEFEFGRDAIAYTMVTQGELTRDGVAASKPNYSSRAVSSGKFKGDKKGFLKSGVISETSEWTHHPAFEGSETTGASPTSENIITYQSTSRFTSQTVKGNPSSIFYGMVAGSPVYWHMSDIQPELAGDFDSRSDFARYQTSNFFPEGWWQDPFTPNLI